MVSNSAKNTIVVEETKIVWVAWTNTDCTEGRGAPIPKAVCEVKSTAIRLGKGSSVQGSDCDLTQETAIRISYQWLIPGRIIRPSKDDRLSQELNDAKEAAREKAIAAGLTEEDIAALIK
jgi:hypothetical protein